MELSCRRKRKTTKKIYACSKTDMQSAVGDREGDYLL